MVTSTRFGVPRGMYFVGLKYLFRTSEKPRFLSAPGAILYGPVAGGGFAERSWFGVPHGSSAANGSARIVRKSPRGFVSVILIVRPLVLIPGMSPLSVSSNFFAPTIVS